MELYVGIDVSKERLDTYVNHVENGDYCFKNSKGGIKKTDLPLKEFPITGPCYQVDYLRIN